MAAGTFTYNALRTETLKERKNTKKNCKSFKRVMLLVKPYLSTCPVGLVWFARCFGKTYSRYLFSSGGFLHDVERSLNYNCI